MKTEFALLTHGEQAVLFNWSEKVRLERVTCELDPGHQRPGRMLTPLSVEIPSGPITDVLWTWQSDLLVGPRAAEVFAGLHLSGYELVKAEVLSSTRNKKPQLWEFKVTGWAGSASPDSGIKLDFRCKSCGHRHYSLCRHPERIIDETNWDGSDFFMVWPLPRFIFVTTKVMQAFRDNDLTGAVFQRIHEINLGTNGFSPGLLEYWMPNSRIATLQDKPE